MQWGWGSAEALRTMWRPGVGGGAGDREQRRGQRGLCTMYVLEKEQKGQQESPQTSSGGTQLMTTWDQEGLDTSTEAAGDLDLRAGMVPPTPRPLQGRLVGATAGPWTAAPRSRASWDQSLWDALDTSTWGQGAGWAAVQPQSRGHYHCKASSLSPGPPSVTTVTSQLSPNSPTCPLPCGSLWGRRICHDLVVTSA